MSDNALKMSTNTQYAFSKDGRVMVVLTKTYWNDLMIFHFDQSTNTFVKHSTILPKAYSYSNTKMELDEYGLTLALYSQDNTSPYLVIYSRSNVNDEFLLSAVERVTNTTSGTHAFDITKQVIVAHHSGNTATVYYCGPTVINTSLSISNGVDRILYDGGSANSTTTNTSNDTTTIQDLLKYATQEDESTSNIMIILAIVVAVETMMLLCVLAYWLQKFGSRLFSSLP